MLASLPSSWAAALSQGPYSRSSTTSIEDLHAHSAFLQLKRAQVPRCQQASQQHNVNVCRTMLVKALLLGAGAASDADARKIARSVVSSSLAKAAVFGHDPNWGRIACAAG